jgi:glycogen operon protein
MIVNGHFDLVRFTLPETVGGTRWSLLIDTNLPHESTPHVFKTGDVYDVTARSLLLFELQQDGVATPAGE